MANILIVDDSMMERKVLGDIMTALGHSVIGEAKNGEQALEEYTKLNPDLVTMDLTMGGCDGAETTSKILSVDPEARIIVISAHQEKHVILDALERGARRFIIKPVSLDAVSEAVTKVLQQPFNKEKHHELISGIKSSWESQVKGPKRRSARILITDDSSFIRQMLRDVVTALGHVVVGEATNGAQAFVEYARLKPDLVTMDLTMPGVEGAETISKIIAVYPEARILVVSAIGSREVVMDALKRGARHFIVKPIRQDKVAAAIEEVLQQKFDLQKHLCGVHKLKASEDTRSGIKYVSPYAISKQDDNLIRVFINQSLTLTSFQALLAELEEYLGDKPRLLLDFGTMSELDPRLFEQFIALIQTIKNNLGLVWAVSNSKEFVNSITSINLENTDNLLAEVLRYLEN